MAIKRVVSRRLKNGALLRTELAMEPQKNPYIRVLKDIDINKILAS